MPLLVGLMFVGCGNGGGEGVRPGLCIGFQAGGVPAASTAVARQGPGSQCNMAEVAVELTDVTDVFTVSFQVAFDPRMARYEGFSLAGSHMSSDGASVQVLENPGAGSISLGITRLSKTTGIDFSGTKTLIRLRFSALSDAVPATGTFTFSNTQVLGSQTPPLKKSGIGWINGTLVVG